MNSPIETAPPSQLRHSQITDVVLWLLRQRRRFRIVGASMLPLLVPDTEVLIDSNAYRQQRPQPGDLVIAYHPRQPGLRLIKWVVYVDDDGCFLKGLNAAASTDSREFGLVPWREIVGRVVCRFP
ncbi:nickel-type superoxide dismutase maturation protease [Leptolyngbya sp. CCNP1308]|uniref:nickel-type superoxide dismutase maturation protease n=1 Tax=Leptolyngbya sp. CCNP1308 TaxID=3110255 RepID=UPI002B203A2C|nr:nickel-type superoxide dismutase maturation protease [Leptolyngbya sp. CCNP1308]MEA5451986.1 nickel-type superoxide dismutase maturation protease [Leptolyngbya sp. CCNP1308]